MSQEELINSRIAIQSIKIRGYVRGFRPVKNIGYVYNLCELIEDFLSSDLKKKPIRRFDDSMLFMM